ncbi:MAG: hypothetical protein PHW66_06490 [Gallionella sp.]|nr:hypothetical protein [Gallionella sp.]
MTIPFRYLLLIALIFAATCFGGGYWKGYGDAGNNAIKRENAALLRYTEKLNQAGVQHDEDQATINRLAADAGRVRVHIPTCPAAAKNPDGSAGLLSDRVDAAFAELQSGTGQLIQRCDQLNIDAIRANNQIN